MLDGTGRELRRKSHSLLFPKSHQVLLAPYRNWRNSLTKPGSGFAPRTSRYLKYPILNPIDYRPKFLLKDSPAHELLMGPGITWKLD